MDREKAVADLKHLSVLYVEDDVLIREMVAHFLSRRVGALFIAEDGRQGLQRFETEFPDLILSDIQMPELDGLEMARLIRQRDIDIPIIFTTAYNDTDFLLKSIDVGADGYVLKPVDLDVLMDCLLKHVDILQQRRELVISRAQLLAYHQKTEEERQLVADLMAKMMREERLHDDRLHYWLQPTEVVGGDLIAALRSPHEKLYMMLADSTGHGLPAALNLLPINHIFYSMVAKGLPLALMVEEMNWAVREQSPIERYVAALLIAVDFDNRIIEVWNGGIPGASFIARDGALLHTFDSTALPLGLLDRTFSARTEIFQWQEGGQLIAYSDGLADAENEAGQPFGTERILANLSAASPTERFGDLCCKVREHLGSRLAHDDITAVMIDCF